MNVKIQKKILYVFIALIVTLPMFATTLRFANSFGSSMVLQRDRPVPVWGWATPGVSVSVSFKSQTKTTQSDGDGRWMVNLDAMSADSIAQSLIATSGVEQVSISNLLVGDVWLYAGPGFLRTMPNVTNSASEISAANYPNIRVLRPDVHKSLLPLADIPAAAIWRPITSGNMPKISIPWYFAREMFLSNRVPVGLILSNNTDDAPNAWLKWQRTTVSNQVSDLQQVSTYLPSDVARAEKWLYNMEHRSTNDPMDLLLFPYYIPYDFYGANPLTNSAFSVKYPTSIDFNSLIQPLIPMAIKAVVLSNNFTATLTNSMSSSDIQNIVSGWRAAWGRPNLPFLLTQPLNGGAYNTKITAAVSAAALLPGVATLAAPVSFSETTSQAYWHDVATALQTMTFDLPATEVPALLPWAAPTTLNTTAAPTSRPFEMGNLFCDNMVLQCEQPIKVWGWAEPGTAVTVTLDGSSQQGTSTPSGRWDVVFPAKVASFTPLQMTITGGGNSLSINNILMGEVWINSGQSNSGFAMSGTLDYAAELPLSDVPSIRYRKKYCSRPICG
jgi:hypothetical protein